LVELAKIGKPHGFRGEFVAHTDTGRGSALEGATELYIGMTADSASPHAVTSATWMPKGWKLKLAGIDSDEKVKTLRGHSVFIDRSAMPPTESGEFYIADLIGAEVRDARSEEPLGRVTSIEPGAGFHDRWVVESPTGTRHVPAVRRYIVRIDAEKRIVWLQNWAELE
jgi:16S rRNA processing protein RimM